MDHYYYASSIFILAAKMDRLHNLRLPRTRHCGFCRSEVYQSHHLSSDDNDEDGDSDAVIGGDNSVRGSQGSDEGLHHISSSALIPSPDELKNPVVQTRLRQADKSAARISLPWNRSTEHLKANVCGWTISSRMDRWNDDDETRERYNGLSACRSWHRFQRKISDLFGHSSADMDDVRSGPVEVAPVIIDAQEHLVLSREEGSPLVTGATNRAGIDDGYEDSGQNDSDLHSSSSSLSNIEEYSESELEIRMDNPFWLD